MNRTIAIENARRYSSLHAVHDPASGSGAVGPRVAVNGLYLPEALLQEHPDFFELTGNEQDMVRFGYDFEYWCWKCIKITDKLSGQLIPFVLNRPQQRLLEEMESQRLAGQPVRIILLKARQWGGSTLVQIYIAWHQLVLYKGKNSVIVGHKRGSSFAIKQMMRTLIKNYPACYQDEDSPLKLCNVPDATDIQEISPRECTISLTSSYSTDASRGQNLSLAHLSEVAFWKSNRSIDPIDLIRSITGTIPLAAGTIIVMESTANGMNSFFYNEWKRAIEGKSAFKPVFVPWSEIPMYSRSLDEDFNFDQCDEYEQALWDKGCCLEQIYWYHEKRKEFNEHLAMKAEFPSNAVEAFESSVKYVFSQQEQDQILENALQPVKIVDDVKYWSEIKPRQEYMTMLTIGSETDVDKPSIISVWRLNRDSENNIISPELAAQWSGAISLSLLALKVTKIAMQFNESLLVVDNNDLGSNHCDRRQGEFIINEIGGNYKKIYYGSKHKNWLEINRDNFSLMYYELIVNAKNLLYIDRDKPTSKAVSLLTVHPNGHYYSSAPCENQLILNRAETLYIIREANLKSSKKFSHEDIRSLTELRIFYSS